MLCSNGIAMPWEHTLNVMHKIHSEGLFGEAF
jgi:hypothetical protein